MEKQAIEIEEGDVFNIGNSNVYRALSKYFNGGITVHTISGPDVERVALKETMLIKVI